MHRLKQGDTIAIVALSKALAPKKNKEIIKNIEFFFQKQSLHTIFYPSCFEDHYLHCPTIESRINDFHQALKDPSIKGIMVARGGRNSNQILKHIDFSLVKKHEKIIIGYSDITTILNAIYHKTQNISYHGPMAIDFLETKRINQYSKNSLMKILFNPEYELDLGKDPRYIQKGSAQGKLIGGNLTSFLQLTGSEYFPDLNNKIIFLEDTQNTPLNSWDRALHQLSFQLGADKIKGILIGKTGKGHKITKQNRKQLFSQLPIFQKLPIITNLDIGHIASNQTLVIGGHYNIQSKI